jgi:protein-disulfide isomerase
MIRKLMIIGCLLSSVYISSAQSKYELHYDEKKMPPLPEKNSDKNSYKRPGDPLPPFTLVSLPWVEIYSENDGKGGKTQKMREVKPMKTYTNADLPADKNVIVMLFNPTCEHCEQQAERFQKNLGVFKNTQLIFLASPTMGPYMTLFAEKFHLNEYPQIWIGLDYDNFIERAFLYYALPQLCIYNKEKKLERMISGGAPVDSLRQYIQ